MAATSRKCASQVRRVESPGHNVSLQVSFALLLFTVVAAAVAVVDVEFAFPLEVVGRLGLCLSWLSVPEWPVPWHTLS
jgi:hypothetical protein